MVEKVSIQEKLQLLDLVNRIGIYQDTVMAGGDIVALTLYDTITVSANSSTSVIVPAKTDYILIGDWIEIDLDEYDVVTVEYKRDGNSVVKTKEPVEVSPQIFPAYTELELYIDNPDNIDHKVSYRWHYIMAKRSKYEGFVTSMYSLINELIGKIAEGKL